MSNLIREWDRPPPDEFLAAEVRFEQKSSPWDEVMMIALAGGICDVLVNSGLCFAAISNTPVYFAALSMLAQAAHLLSMVELSAR
jgi:hypothetical protein